MASTSGLRTWRPIRSTSVTSRMSDKSTWPLSSSLIQGNTCAPRPEHQRPARCRGGSSPGCEPVAPEVRAPGDEHGRGRAPAEDCAGGNEAGRTADRYVDSQHDDGAHADGAGERRRLVEAAD